MNKTQLLSKELEKIYAAHANEIKKLSYTGPRGGHNAANIPGWSVLGIHAVTRAAKLANLPTLSAWSGSNPTPSTAIPACIRWEARNAYIRIFDKEKDGWKYFP